MRRRPVARVTTGAAVAAVALTSVFAGTAWAPKITTGFHTRDACRFEGWRAMEYLSLQDCYEAVKTAEKIAKADKKDEK